MRKPGLMAAAVAVVAASIAACAARKPVPARAPAPALSRAEAATAAPGPAPVPAPVARTPETIPPRDALPRGPAAAGAPGDELVRAGDEIMVCGRLFHTGAPVVLWLDPGGYDAYRVERRFARPEEASWDRSKEKLETPNRYGVRAIPAALAESRDEAELALLRAGSWDLPALQETVDQFVIHYDAAGTSRTCFRILHDVRGLSVHFMLDVDGTIYQTLDLKERAWHATVANDRSVGIEIANIGAYPERGGQDGGTPLDQWYARDEDGRARLTIPARLDGGGIRTPGFAGRPARDEPVTGEVQGRVYRQFDLTPEQYESLTKLTAALCTVLPRIERDYPRDASGALATRALLPEEFRRHRGLIGHYHIQENKVDPGPAFQWDRVVEGARELTAARSAPSDNQPR
ncbi:MAG: N-acetylmuramoyl-L-alanine amidase [Phycisphaerales bacterium]